MENQVRRSEVIRDGKCIAMLEKTLKSGDFLLPIIVECLQKQFSINDCSLFFESYNMQKENTDV